MRPLLAAAAWAVRVLLAYVAVALAAAVLPLFVRRPSRSVTLALRLAPRVLQRAVLAGAVTAAVASAGGVAEASAATCPGAGTGPAWPQACAPEAPPASAPVAPSNSPAPTSPAPTSPAPTSAAPTSPAVVVRPGDSLWAIAARHLPDPTPARVAAAWPRWWAANRAAVGSDPSLIHPGQRLAAPTSPSEASS